MFWELILVSQNIDFTVSSSDFILLLIRKWVFPIEQIGKIRWKNDKNTLGETLAKRRCRAR